MKVLMTADTVGGVWTYAIELASALSMEGVRVDLATMGRPPSAAQHAEAAAVPELHLHTSSYKLEWMEDPWEDVAAAGAWLLALESRCQPDVIHLNGYAHARLPWRAPVMVAGHSCVCSWWQAVRGEAAPAEWGRYRRAVSEGLAAADLVVAPTQAMLDVLAAHYGSLLHGRVVPNGRDAALFPPGEAQPLIFSAGRIWDEAKNVAALAAVAQALDWPVYLAGDQQRPDHADVAELHGVVPLGQLLPGEIAQWVGRASIYALPACYEPFGLSALEAALAGCALVLGDIPSLREVWGEAALFVPPADQTALRGALQCLIDNAPLRTEMADRARSRARRYSPRLMASRYATLYHQLVRLSPGRPAQPQDAPAFTGAAESTAVRSRPAVRHRPQH